MPAFTRNMTDHFLPFWDKAIGETNGRFAKGIEIGVFEGRSTLAFVDRYLRHESSYLVAVNLPKWNERERFLTNVGPLIEAEKVRPLYGNSFDCLAELHVDQRRNKRAGFDFVYVDGSHYAWNVYSDLCQAFWLLKVGGAMICDDYVYAVQNPNYPRKEWVRVDWAIDAFAKCYGPLIEELPSHRRQKIFRRVE